MNIIANGAAELEQYIEQHFIDSNGLLYSFLDSSTDAPPTAETFRGNPGKEWKDWKIGDFTQAEHAAYENYGMVTYSFGSAMLLKYQLTGDPEALKIVRRTLNSVWHVAEIGKELEFGYLPKIYGNRFSKQTSTDQYMYLLNFLDEYRRADVCTAEERTRIEEMIVAAVEFWRKRDYRYTYFIYENMKWPPLRFPSFLALAYNVTGDKKYKLEAEEIIADNIAYMPECSVFSRRHLADHEKESGEQVIYNLSDRVSMDTLNAWIYLHNDPESKFANVWRACMVQMALEGLRVMCDDGQCYISTFYNLKDHTLRRADKIGHDSDHGARTGWSTMILRGCMMAAEENPGFRSEMIAHAEDILSKFDNIKKFNYINEEDIERINPAYQFKCRFISGDAVAQGLWSYYLLQKLKNMQ